MENIGKTDFEFYSKFAKSLILTLQKTEERILAAAWFSKLKDDACGSEQLRLDYLKLLLFVLQRQRLAGPFLHNPNELDELAPFEESDTLAGVAKSIIEKEQNEKRENFMKRIRGEIGDFPPFSTDYSADMLEYVAAQDIPNFGIHVYYAISKEPLTEWERAEHGMFPKLKRTMEPLGGISETSFAFTEPKPSDIPESPAKGDAGGLPAHEEPGTPSPKKKSPKKSPFGGTPPAAPLGVILPAEDLDERAPPTWGSNLIEVEETLMDEKDDEPVPSPTPSALSPKATPPKSPISSSPKDTPPSFRFPAIEEAPLSPIPLSPRGTPSRSPQAPILKGTPPRLQQAPSPKGTPPRSPRAPSPKGTPPRSPQAPSPKGTPPRSPQAPSPKGTPPRSPQAASPKFPQYPSPPKSEASFQSSAQGSFQLINDEDDFDLLGTSLNFTDIMKEVDAVEEEFDDSDAEASQQESDVDHVIKEFDEMDAHMAEFEAKLKMYEEEMGDDQDLALEEASTSAKTSSPIRTPEKAETPIKSPPKHTVAIVEDAEKSIRVISTSPEHLEEADASKESIVTEMAKKGTPPGRTGLSSPRTVEQVRAVKPPPLIQRSRLRPPSKIPGAPGGSKLQPPGGSGLQPPGGSRLQPPGGSRLQPPGGSRLQVPGGSRLQAPGGSRLQPPGGSSLQTPSGSRLQPPGGSRLQPPGGSRLQPPGGSRLQPPGGSRLQPPGGSKLQPPGGSRLQPPGGSKLQPPGGSKLAAPGSSGIPAPGGSGIPAPGGSGIPAPGGSRLRPPGGSKISAPGVPRPSGIKPPLSTTKDAKVAEAIDKSLAGAELETEEEEESSDVESTAEEEETTPSRVRVISPAEEVNQSIPSDAGSPEDQDIFDEAEEEFKALQRLQELYDEIQPNIRPDLERTPPMFSKHPQIRKAARKLRYRADEFDIDPTMEWQSAPDYLEDVPVPLPYLDPAMFQDEDEELADVSNITFMDDVDDFLFNEDIPFPSSVERLKAIGDKADQWLDSSPAIATGVPLTSPRPSVSPVRIGPRINLFDEFASPPLFPESPPQISPGARYPDIYDLPHVLTASDMDMMTEAEKYGEGDSTPSPHRRSFTPSPDRRRPTSSPDRRSPSSSPDRRSLTSSPDRRSPTSSTDRRSPTTITTPVRRSPTSVAPIQTTTPSPTQSLYTDTVTKPTDVIIPWDYKSPEIVKRPRPPRTPSPPKSEEYYVPPTAEEDNVISQVPPDLVELYDEYDDDDELPKSPVTPPQLSPWSIEANQMLGQYQISPQGTISPQKAISSQETTSPQKTTPRSPTKLPHTPPKVSPWSIEATQMLAQLAASPPRTPASPESADLFEITSPPIQPILEAHEYTPSFFDPERPVRHPVMKVGKTSGGSHSVMRRSGPPKNLESISEQPERWQEEIGTAIELPLPQTPELLKQPYKTPPRAVPTGQELAALDKDEERFIDYMWASDPQRAEYYKKVMRMVQDVVVNDELPTPYHIFPASPTLPDNQDAPDLEAEELPNEEMEEEFTATVEDKMEEIKATAADQYASLFDDSPEKRPAKPVTPKRISPVPDEYYKETSPVSDEYYIPSFDIQAHDLGLSPRTPSPRAAIQSRQQTPGAPSRSPQVGPSARSPQAGPSTRSPQAGPSIRSPQAGPSIRSPQAGPSIRSPQAGPSIRSPQAGPSTRSPQAGPSTRSPQAGPSTPSPPTFGYTFSPPKYSPQSPSFSLDDDDMDALSSSLLVSPDAKTPEPPVSPQHLQDEAFKKELRESHFAFPKVSHTKKAGRKRIERHSIYSIRQMPQIQEDVGYTTSLLYPKFDDHKFLRKKLPPLPKEDLPDDLMGTVPITRYEGPQIEPQYIIDDPDQPPDLQSPIKPPITLPGWTSPPRLIDQRVRTPPYQAPYIVNPVEKETIPELYSLDSPVSAGSPGSPETPDGGMQYELPQSLQMEGFTTPPQRVPSPYGAYTPTLRRSTPGTPPQRRQISRSPQTYTPPQQQIADFPASPFQFTPPRFESPPPMSPLSPLAPLPPLSPMSQPGVMEEVLQKAAQQTGQIERRNVRVYAGRKMKQLKRKSVQTMETIPDTESPGNIHGLPARYSAIHEPESQVQSYQGTSPVVFAPVDLNLNFDLPLEQRIEMIAPDVPVQVPVTPPKYEMPGFEYVTPPGLKYSWQQPSAQAHRVYSPTASSEKPFSVRRNLFDENFVDKLEEFEPGDMKIPPTSTRTPPTSPRTPRTSPHVYSPTISPEKPYFARRQLLDESLLDISEEEEPDDMKTPPTPRTSPQTPRTSPQTPRTSPQIPRTSPQTPRTSPQTPRTSPQTPPPSPISFDFFAEADQRTPRTFRRAVEQHKLDKDLYVKPRQKLTDFQHRSMKGPSGRVLYGHEEEQNVQESPQRSPIRVTEGQLLDLPQIPMEKQLDAIQANAQQQYEMLGMSPPTKPIIYEGRHIFDVVDPVELNLAQKALLDDMLPGWQSPPKSKRPTSPQQSEVDPIPYSTGFDPIPYSTDLTEEEAEDIEDEDMPEGWYSPDSPQQSPATPEYLSPQQQRAYSSPTFFEGSPPILQSPTFVTSPVGPSPPSITKRVKSHQYTHEFFDPDRPQMKKSVRSGRTTVSFAKQPPGLHTIKERDEIPIRTPEKGVDQFYTTGTPESAERHYVPPMLPEVVRIEARAEQPGDESPKRRQPSTPPRIAYDRVRKTLFDSVPQGDYDMEGFTEFPPSPETPSPQRYPSTSQGQSPRTPSSTRTPGIRPSPTSPQVVEIEESEEEESPLSESFTWDASEIPEELQGFKWMD